METVEELARANHWSWFGTVEKSGNRGRSRPIRVFQRVFTALLLASALAGCQSAEDRSGLYVVSANGGTPRKISGQGGAPVWSPDGSKLAWGDEDGLTIWTKGEDSLMVLTEMAIAGLPAWSPDGKSLAAVNRDERVLAAIDVRTGERQMEIPIELHGDRSQFVYLGGPSWSPDGAAIAYVCSDGAGDEVCTVGVDARNWRQLTKLEPPTDLNPRAESNAGPPAWSPNGELIAVAAYPEQRGAPAGVFIVDLSRGNASRVSQLLPNSAIDWSRESRSILFSARDRNRSDVFEVSVRGGTPANQTANLESGSRNPTFSPDSGRFAVVAGETIAVVENGEERNLFQIPGFMATDPAWSPTGDEIAFVARPNPVRSFD